MLFRNCLMLLVNRLSIELSEYELNESFDINGLEILLSY